MTFIGKRSGSRYVSFRHPSRLTTQDSGRWQEGRRGAGPGQRKHRWLGAPPEATSGREGPCWSRSKTMPVLGDGPSAARLSCSVAVGASSANYPPRTLRVSVRYTCIAVGQPCLAALDAQLPSV